jgi:hypothetical protein
MLPQLYFFLSIAFSFIACGMVSARYIWPQLRLRERNDALRPLLILHNFRFVGLAFLVPGVVSPDLPSAFAHSAAYGDMIAATLALLALLSLSNGVGTAITWIFNLWGTADLLNAFYQANRAGVLAGQLGATYFIPTLVVPLLLITHALAFRVLLGSPRQSSQSAWPGHRASIRQRERGTIGGVAVDRSNLPSLSDSWSPRAAPAEPGVRLPGLPKRRLARGR